MIDRRSPVRGLPGMAQLRALSPEARTALRAILMSIRADAAARAQASWRKHKAPMAAYWKAVSVYAGHIARTLREPQTQGDAS